MVGYGLVVSLGLAMFVAPFACPWPDGLETVAAKLGFEHRGGAVLPAPLADYALPGCKSPVGGDGGGRGRGGTGGVWAGAVAEPGAGAQARWR